MTEIRNKRMPVLLNKIQKQLLSELKRLTKLSENENIEYGSAICMGNSHLYLYTIKGSSDSVEIPDVENKVAEFHTHPQSVALMSQEDMEDCHLPQLIGAYDCEEFNFLWYNPKTSKCFRLNVDDTIDTIYSAVC